MVRKVRSFDPHLTGLALRGASAALVDNRAEISDFARLHAELDEGTRSLTALLRDQRRSIAIVGNSACELNSGKGHLIDAHDLVAQFNRFSVEDEFARDYGRKCNIHVRHPQDVTINNDSAASDWTVINRPDLIYRERKWKNVLALSTTGVKISALPTDFTAPISKPPRRTEWRHYILRADKGHARTLVARKLFWLFFRRPDRRGS